MHAHFNRFELEDFARRAAQAYLQGGEDLNDSITKIARENEFTSHHVDRVVQTANTMVNGALVKQAKDENADPRISFELAKSEEVVRRLASGQDKLAELRREAEVIDLFTVKKASVDTSAVVDGVLGKTAADPYANHAQSLDHMDLTKLFVKNAADDTAKNADAQTIGRVCQNLESLEKQAKIDHSAAKNAMLDAEDDLRSEIHDQILVGMAPATVRDVIKHAELDEDVAKAIDQLITKVAADLQVREGKSAFCDRSLVNKHHPLIDKAASVKGKINEAVRVGKGLSKIAAARAAARSHYTRAVREGR